MANFQRESLTFDQALDFTRGSEATYIGPDGLIQTAAVDEPRFTYDPETGEALGLLIEEQRTRLNTIAAAPIGPEDVTVTATAHTISFYGTGSVDLTGAATETLVGTGADERVTLTFAPTAGTLTITPSGTVADLQIEEGSFATSVIRGEGSQVTRAADNCSRTLGAEWNDESWTVYGEFTLAGRVTGSSANQSILYNDKTSVGGMITLMLRGGEDFWQLRIANSYSSNIIPFADVPPVEGNKYAFAISCGPNGSAVSINGFSASAGLTAPPVSAWLLGRAAAYYSRCDLQFGALKTLPLALSEQELIALTTPEAE